jgi:uncharacterized RDD family membrane protein YckC
MADAIYCNTCGAQNRGDARFCSHCGHSLVPAAPAPAMTAPQLAAPLEAAPTMELTAPLPPTMEMTPPNLTPPPAPPMMGGTAYIPPAPAWPAPPVHYAGFWIRFLAFVIDAVIVDVFILPFSLMLGAAIGIAGMAVRMPGNGIQAVNIISGAAFGMLANWLYEALMTSSSREATLGKMVVGIKVTDLAGQRISFARAGGRHFAKYISGFVFFIGYFMIGFTERKQGLHDMIAGTLVRYK